MNKLLTLCYVYQAPNMLLGMKKRGFGAGRWNGFGGKVAPDETVEQAARRESLEEAGITVTDLQKVGVLEFVSVARPGEKLEVHIFKTDTFAGTPVESEQMLPQWFPVADVPFASMWSSDPYWFSLMLEDKKFTGSFLFGEDDVVLEHEVKVVDEL